MASVEKGIMGFPQIANAIANDDGASPVREGRYNHAGEMTLIESGRTDYGNFEGKDAFLNGLLADINRLATSYKKDIEYVKISAYYTHGKTVTLAGLPFKAVRTGSGLRLTGLDKTGGEQGVDFKQRAKFDEWWALINGAPPTNLKYTITTIKFDDPAQRPTGSVTPQEPAQSEDGAQEPMTDDARGAAQQSDVPDDIADDREGEEYIELRPVYRDFRDMSYYFMDECKRQKPSIPAQGRDSAIVTGSIFVFSGEHDPEPLEISFKCPLSTRVATVLGETSDGTRIRLVGGDLENRINREMEKAGKGPATKVGVAFDPAE